VICHVELFIDYVEGEPAIMACGQRLHFDDEANIVETGHDFVVQKHRRLATCPACVTATMPEPARSLERVL